MKKFLFTAAISLLGFLISCNSKNGTTNTSSQAERNKANTRMVYNAIKTGDVSSLDSIIDKDIVDHSGPNGTEIKGRDSVKAMLGSVHNHIKNISMDIIADATDGDYDMTLARMTGTTTDTAMSMPAGTKMDQTFVDVVKIKNGKAVEHWEYDDAKDIMKMMHAEGAGINNMDKMNKMHSSKDSSRM